MMGVETAPQREAGPRCAPALKGGTHSFSPHTQPGAGCLEVQASRGDLPLLSPLAFVVHVPRRRLFVSIPFLTPLNTGLPEQGEAGASHYTREIHSGRLAERSAEAGSQRRFRLTSKRVFPAPVLPELAMSLGSAHRVPHFYPTLELTEMGSPAEVTSPILHTACLTYAGRDKFRGRGEAERQKGKSLRRELRTSTRGPRSSLRRWG